MKGESEMSKTRHIGEWTVVVSLLGYDSATGLPYYRAHGYNELTGTLFAGNGLMGYRKLSGGRVYNTITDLVASSSSLPR